MQNLDGVTFEKALEYYGGSVGAMLIADRDADSYRTLVRRGIFERIVAESGKYSDLVQKLWFHFQNSDKAIAEEYQVFIPNLNIFTGKYSKRLTLMVDGQPYIVQMMIQPFGADAQYLFLLDELDEHACEDDTETKKKVSTIQNIYLFSMCFDLVHDTTSSLSLTEVSDETINYELSYTDWRKMIAGMFMDDGKALFLERSDPEYLRTHFAPGQLDSFDIQMKNLEGQFIWVKLIFSRMATNHENDYRFVYMVQNIHEATVSMQKTLKDYEERASRDPMTKVYNHGHLETEIANAAEKFCADGKPVSLLMMDLDHFKQVNDQYGHAVGDAALTHFAETVSGLLSGRDAVFGRWGGEEFAAVVYDTDETVMQEIAEMIRSSMEQVTFDTVGTITCSIGAAELKAGESLGAWFERADKALYAAKSDGRNRVCMG